MSESTYLTQPILEHSSQGDVFEEKDLENGNKIL